MNNQDVTQTGLKNQVQPTRVVTFSWFDNGFCPDQYLANLIERYNSAVKPFSEGILAFKAATKLVEGNAVDVRITSFHGLIDLDRNLYPILTNARATNEPVFSKATFSLADMGMDSGNKLFCLREYIRFVQNHWALPGLYIGLSMHLVREIADLAYWKNYTLELRMDKHDDALVTSVHFPNIQDQDFVINIFRNGIDKQFDPYPTLKEWLRFYRNVVKEAAELWTIRIVVNESIAEKIGCLSTEGVLITNAEMPPCPCL